MLDAHCEARGYSRCDAALHRCVECGLDQDCASGEGCDLNTRRCAQTCVDDDNCPEDNHGCDESRGLCVECETDDDDGCVAFAGRPYCSVTGSFCVACRSDADCTAGGHCDSVSGLCRECRDTRDCPSGEVCAPDSYECTTGGS